MKSFVVVLALTCSGAVFAWGNTGHRVVGEVASRFLEISTIVKTNQILDGQSLARVSTWPDEIKSDAPNYQYTFNWHYTTWQTEAHDHSESNETATTGLLLKSINEQLAVLKDPEAAKEKKAFALKFLVHLIGDIHQPLHVGNGTDQGGNFCKVTYMSKPYNLHSLWDEGIIDYSNLSFTEMARFVYQGRSLEEIQKAKTGTVLDWARESKELVPTLYPADVTPSTEPISIRKYCQKEVLPEDVPKLSYEYAYKHLPVIEKRLFEAGIRLAVLLNEALK